MDGTGLGSSSVASRFVSQTQLSEAQKKREEDIRAAYARMGQSPPPEAFQVQEDYDPRSLYDKLKANSDAKQEAFDEKTKLANQFRGIDDAESEFLAEVARERRDEQKKRDEETKQELEEFRKAALAKESSPPGPVGATASTAKSEESSSVATKSKMQGPAGKGKGKRKREGLLGVVKKKPSVAGVSEQGPKTSKRGEGSAETSGDKGNGNGTTGDGEEEGGKEKRMKSS